LYFVTALDENGCSSYNDTWVYVDSCVSNTNFENLSSFTIYPNPSKGLFNISSKNNDEINIEIFNSLGDKVFDLVKISSLSTVKIDLTNLNAGVYLMKVISDGEYIYKKVVIE
jgi:hypothetical protein